MKQDQVQSLNHVVGQKQAVNVLRTALDAFFHDRFKSGEETAFPHVLMCGPAGVGKTLLSETLASELCCNLHTELAQNLANPTQVHGLLMMLEAGDCLFLDEIHQLSSTVQVTLYRALEEGMLFLGGKKQVIQLPPFCLIGATTDEYLLTKSMRDRFRILLRLQHYSESEMEVLIRQRATRLGWSIEDDAARDLSGRCRGVPRLAVRLLESAKRVTSSESEDIITACHVSRMCVIEQIDHLGLDAVEKKYLHILRDGQGPVRLNVIATQLGLPRRSVEAVFEADLLRLGLITKTEKGRMLTAKGADHLSQISIHDL